MVTALGASANYSATLPDTTQPQDLSGEYAILAASSSDYNVPTHGSTYYVYWGYYSYWSYPYWDAYLGYWGSFWNDDYYWSYLTYPQTASSYLGANDAYSYLGAPQELDLETYWKINQRGDNFWDLSGQIEEAVEYDLSELCRFTLAGATLGVVEPYPEVSLPVGQPPGEMAEPTSGSASPTMSCSSPSSGDETADGDGEAASGGEEALSWEWLSHAVGGFAEWWWQHWEYWGEYWNYLKWCAQWSPRQWQLFFSADWQAGFEYYAEMMDPVSQLDPVIIMFVLAPEDVWLDWIDSYTAAFGWSYEGVQHLKQWVAAERGELRRREGDRRAQEFFDELAKAARAAWWAKRRTPTEYEKYLQDLEQYRQDYRQYVEDLKKYNEAWAKYDREMLAYYLRVMEEVDTVMDILWEGGFERLQYVHPEYCPPKHIVQDYPGHMRGPDGESLLKVRRDEFHPLVAFPRGVGRLRGVITYVLAHYNEMSWDEILLTGGSSFNLRPFVLPPPGLHINRDDFRGGNEFQAIMLILHEALHDWSWYHWDIDLWDEVPGVTHHRIREIVGPTGNEDQNDVWSRFEKFCRNAFWDGKSLWDRMLENAAKASPKPTPPTLPRPVRPLRPFRELPWPKTEPYW